MSEKILLAEQTTADGFNHIDVDIVENSKVGSYEVLQIQERHGFKPCIQMPVGW